MTHIKSTLSAALGFILVMAALGFFASVGFALIGVLAAVGLVSALSLGIRSLFSREDNAFSAAA